MTVAENETSKGTKFWHPPWWKWGVVAALLAVAATMLLWKHSARIELLPYTDSPPPWNGSFPYLTISLVDAGSENVKFEASLLLIEPTVRHQSAVNNFQVDLHSGMFVLRQTDLFIPDSFPLVLTRTYRPWSLHSRAFGKGTNHPYDICPTGSRYPYTYMDINLEDGRQIHLRRISKGIGYADAVFRHDETSSEFYGAQVAWNGNGWTLSFRDSRRFLFPESYFARNCAQGAPRDLQDAAGHHIHLQRDKERNLERLISPSGRTITFNYDNWARVVEASDDAGNVRRYTYDSTGHLETVSSASHLLYRFEYTKLLSYPGYDPYLMTVIRDGTGKVLLQNAYRNGGEISGQRLANGDVYKYKYVFVGNSIIETIVNGPTGERKLFFRHGVFTKEE